MNARAPKESGFSTSLNVAIAPSQFGDDVVCLVCHFPLELHQPDTDQPERLVGICRNCQTWALINIDDNGVATLTELPKLPCRKPRRR
jgi:hypothetical protein